MSHKPTPSASAHARLHINLRLERWHRRCIYASCAVLFVSGVAWLVMHYFMRPTSQFGETIYPLEPWAMKLHGAATMVTLFFLGSLLNSHIRRALKAGRNLVSGWGMIATMLILIVSGFGLYYLASESDRLVWSGLHWIVGIGGAVLIVLHIVLGRRSHVHRIS